MWANTYWHSNADRLNHPIRGNSHSRQHSIPIVYKLPSNLIFPVRLCATVENSCSLAHVSFSIRRQRSRKHAFFFFHPRGLNLPECHLARACFGRCASSDKLSLRRLHGRAKLSCSGLYQNPSKDARCTHGLFFSSPKRHQKLIPYIHIYPRASHSPVQ